MPFTRTIPLDDEALLGLLPDAVFALDADGLITRWTHGAEQIYGYTAAEALGRDLAELLNSRLPQPLGALLRTVAETGRWRGMVIQRSRSGRETSVESRWTAHYGERDSLQGVLAVDRAVGAHPGAARRAPARSGIAHEFNNLLMIIGNYATLVDDQLERMHRETGEPRLQALRGDIGQIQSAAARATALTRHLFATSAEEIDPRLAILAGESRSRPAGPTLRRG